MKVMCWEVKVCMYNMTMQEIFLSLVSRNSFQITLQVLAIWLRHS